MKKIPDLQTRDLIVTIIEKNLLQMGKRNHDKIIKYLKQEHDSSISDCYVKPKILKLALKKHLGEKTDNFIELMTRDLEKINQNQETVNFLKSLQKQ